LPAVLHAAITLVASAAPEHEETSKTLFYVAGGVLAAFAVVISAIGIRGHETFPPSKGAARAVMALAAVLVAFTMFSAVITG
jgi:drug/metabolite transporter (DMT)-like permease